MKQTAKKVAIVGGCGHAGLPLSIALARHHQVHVYDTDEVAVALVRSGRMPFREDGADAELPQLIGRSLFVSSNPTDICNCEVVVVVIGTPVDEHLNPDFRLFRKVFAQLEGSLRSGQTLMLRSTVYPGTSQKVAELLQQKGLDIEVVFCPERVAEGFGLREIRMLPQIISGFSRKGLDSAREVFGPLAVELVELPPIEAELAKLFTNSWRYISFAVANQFFMVAADHGLDYDRILRAMKHNYPRAQGLPGPGFTAGPCLFKDTMQLAAFADNQFFLGHSAMLVNEGMPRFVVNRIRARFPDLAARVVGILGMAFKAGSDDLRESLSYKLKKILDVEAGRVLTTDPYVKDDSLRPLEEVVEASDILVMGVPHPDYRSLDFGGKPLVDIWTARGFGR